MTYTRDALGRIASKTARVGAEVAHTFNYSYDMAGRLNDTSKDGVPTSHYAYDSNGNRTVGPGLTSPPAYDAQDRLTGYGVCTYTYKADGSLQTKTCPGGATTYDYDAFGNLRHVTLPNATQLEYVIDGQNRRIGKKVNGILVEGFIYRSQLQPAAWLDGKGAVQATFVYGLRSNVPEYMVRGGVTYRLFTDQVGSVRLVVNTSTGAVAERLDYDEFGSVLSDTAPGTQPFGFAGGLYDRDTGLLRFGARDYDPTVGRWTNKDPVRFAGGLNLYAYVGNDPVDWKDPSGLLVEAQYDASSGTLQVIDLDTGRMVITNAESGGKPFGDPIPNGAYEIFEQGRRSDFFRLDALDAHPRNDIHDPTGRDHFRLHRPGLTTGCIAAKDRSGWEQVKDLIENTSTETVTDQAPVPWYTPSHWSDSPRPLAKYGTLIVVGSR